MKYTQEQLEAMSDFDLSKLVAEKEGFSTDNGYGFMDSEGNVVCYDVIAPIDGDPYSVEVRKNYPNSWADMGQIIQRNLIDIEWPEYDLGGVGQATKWIEGDSDIMVEFYEKEKGLRACAIVYLLMEEL